MAKPYNYHKLCRQTHGFRKRASVREKIDAMNKKPSEFAQREQENKYNWLQKDKMRFATYKKGGNYPIEFFETREQAQAKIDSCKCPSKYEIREILEW